MVGIVPTSTKVKLKKTKAKTLPPITPNLNIENRYVKSLDNIVDDYTKIIHKEVTPIFEDLISVQKEWNAQKGNLLKDAFYDSSEPITFYDGIKTIEDYNKAVAELQEKLEDKVEKLKNRFDMDNPSINKMVSKNISEIDKYTNDSLKANIEKQYGISRLPQLNTPAMKKVIDDSLEVNVNLIKNVGTEYVDKVSKAVLDNFSRVGKRDGKSLIDEVYDEREGVTKTRAKTIARDQSAKITEAFNSERYKAYGMNQAVWAVADFTARTRSSHLKLNGDIYDIDKGAKKDDGTYIQPAQEVNCRCTCRPVVPDGLFD